MNYNANIGPRPLGRKPKRVSDVNSMGGSMPQPPQQQAPFVPYNPQAPFQNGAEFNQPPNYGYQMNGPPPGFNPQYMGDGAAPNFAPCMNMPMHPQQQQQQQQQQQAQFGMFSQPLVQDMAMQYGQRLADTGKSMVKQEIEKYVPVSHLKYYFAVDTKYVVAKLGLLFFPFKHSDWSIKYEQDSPVQPRYEINAPDLYIPTMAYLTYVLVAGLVLGMQQRFSPEQIGIQASSALAWCLVELCIYKATLYITNIQTTLRTLDLLAYSGYKYVGIITSILLSLILNRTGYYVGLVYCNVALAFFLIGSLRILVLPESQARNQGQYYDDAQTSVGSKRRRYFLLFVACMQPLLSWWLSFHLIGFVPINTTTVPI